MNLCAPGADVRLRIMMWPKRGPKASQKDPMAIREKHVPELGTIQKLEHNS